MHISNDLYELGIDEATCAISRLFIKRLGVDLIGEPRLLANFRLCLPLEGYLANYVEGMVQRPAAVECDGSAVRVRFSGMESDRGRFDIDLTYRIAFEDGDIRFSARLTNNGPQPVSEFWFPRIGGWTEFDAGRKGAAATPGYHVCAHNAGLFDGFPGGQGLGAEAAEWSVDYPGGAMVMPWMDLHDPKTDTGLYMGYHDTTLRQSTWHFNLLPTASGTSPAWLTKEQAHGEPVGLVFSHVRYPFIRGGETFETGEFVLRVHEGDWHRAGKHYRGWFMKHFPFSTDDSWLRRESAWFTSIIYQPEDRVVADYETLDGWVRDARDCGINTTEIIGWDKGGLERQYPEYEPEEKLGGREGWVRLLKSIKERGGRSLPFVNYNILDPNTDWYKRELHKYTHQDQFGDTPNWMAWGESTLIARKAISVRRHRLASVVPPLKKILEDHFVQLARDGADGLQIDKLCVGSALDWNPLLEGKPDEADFEGLIQGIAEALEKCRAVNPEFRFAGEAIVDRLLPYVDVFYRAVGGVNICPLRYVFPEWTAVQHVAYPYDFNGVNAAVLTGAVVCVEPFSYQGTLAHPCYRELGRYVKEVERIRAELKDIIFLGDYEDTLGAEVVETAAEPMADEVATRGPGGEVIMPGGAAVAATTGSLHYRVHRCRKTGLRAIVVVNLARTPRAYTWSFTEGNPAHADLHEPFKDILAAPAGESRTIGGEGLHIIVEKH